jgi:prepilin-type N-terminal cleavage/methylation domain-containing protein
MRRPQTGLTMIEVLFAIAILATLTALAIPFTTGALDELRTAMAARYLSGLVMGARVSAVARSASVGLQFQSLQGDYWVRPIVDGNHNGIRTDDIRSGIDRPLAVAERLRDKFPGVSFGIMAGVPDIDGVTGGARDGVRIGTARILTMSTNGTATPGTLYVRGRSSQYAVRVLGATGRTRVLQYRTGGHAWVSR